MWKIVLSIQSIDGIKKSAYAIRSLVAPLLSDSPQGHLKEPTTVESSWNNATHQYIRNPTAARSMNGTMYVIQEFGIPPQRAAPSSIRERPKPYENKTSGPAIKVKVRIKPRLTSTNKTQDPAS
tara:strand:- start:520 stop:891 length:372 start_codon:yes stop_codon:yes gene_type:complete